MIIATWEVREGDVKGQRLGFQDASELSKQVDSREKDTDWTKDSHREECWSCEEPQGVTGSGLS